MPGVIFFFMTDCFSHFCTFVSDIIMAPNVTIAKSARVDEILSEYDDRVAGPNAMKIRGHLESKAGGHRLPGEKPPLAASRGAIVYMPGEHPDIFNYAGPDERDRQHHRRDLPSSDFVLVRDVFWMHAASSPVAGKKNGGGGVTTNGV